MIIKIKKAHSVLYFREITRKKSLQAQSNSSGKPDYNSYHHSFISSYGWDMHWSTCFYILDWFESEQFSRQVAENIAIPVIFLIGMGALQVSFMGTLANRQYKRDYALVNNYSKTMPVPEKITQENLSNLFTEKENSLKLTLKRTRSEFTEKESKLEIAQTNLRDAIEKYQELTLESRNLDVMAAITPEEKIQRQKRKEKLHQEIQANQRNQEDLVERLVELQNKKALDSNKITSLELDLNHLKSMLKENQKQVSVQYVESWLFKSFATNYHSMVKQNMEIIKEKLDYSQKTWPVIHENVLNSLQSVITQERFGPAPNISFLVEAWKDTVNRSKSVMEESYKLCLNMIDQYETALDTYSLEIALDNSQALKHESVVARTYNQFKQNITRLQTNLKGLDSNIDIIHQQVTDMQNKLENNFNETLASINREFRQSFGMPSEPVDDFEIIVHYPDFKTILDSMNSLNKFTHLLARIELNKQCLLELKTVCSQDISASELSNSKLLQALIQQINLREFESIWDFQVNHTDSSSSDSDIRTPSPKKLRPEIFSDFSSHAPTKAEKILAELERQGDNEFYLDLSSSRSTSLSLSETLTHANPDETTKKSLANVKEANQLIGDLLVDMKKSSESQHIDILASSSSSNQTNQDPNLENRSSMDSFKNKLDKQAESSSPDTAAKIWSLFIENYWPHFEQAIEKAKQEQKKYLLELTQKIGASASKNVQNRFVPVKAPNVTDPKPPSYLREAEGTIANAYNENVMKLRELVVKSQNVEENASSMNVDMSTVSNSTSIKERIVNLVYKISEFTTKGFIVAHLYEPIYFSAKSIFYQKPLEKSQNYKKYGGVDRINQRFDSEIIRFSINYRDFDETNVIQVPTKDLNPFSQLHVTETNLDPQHPTVRRPLPAIGFHHNHYYALKFKNLSIIDRSNIPVVHQDQFLRFMGNQFTREWITSLPDFKTQIEQKKYKSLRHLFGLSPYKHQNININDQLKNGLNLPPANPKLLPITMVDRIDQVANLDQTGSEKHKKYLETLQDQIRKFGREYKKVASFPIFQLGSQHYHKSSRSDPQAISSDNFFQKYLQPFISNDQTGAVDFLELLSNKYYQGIEHSKENKDTVTSLIKEYIMPLSPYAPKPEQADPNQTPQQANGFIFHNLETDRYELCQQSKVYQDIQSDLMRVERILKQDWSEAIYNRKSAQAQDYADLYKVPLYHPLFTPYLVDATTSELMHILRSHRFPGVPNLTQPFRASRFEFNVHLDECARHIQHQAFFTELGKLLVQEDFVKNHKQDGRVELKDHTQIHLRNQVHQAKPAYRFYEYVVPSHMIMVKTIIISHILLALKYSIQFSGTIPS